jgi:dihydroflavonol-4-reductase
VPYALTLIGGVMGEITGRLTNKEPLACLASVRMGKYPHYVTSDKAKRELGYSPGPIRESLKEEIEWFRAQGMV